MSRLSDRRHNWQNKQRQNQPGETLSTYESSDFLELLFEPRRIFQYLITIISCLVAIHIIGQFYRYVFNEGLQTRLIILFNLDEEACIPSIYSSFALLLCSVKTRSRS